MTARPGQALAAVLDFPDFHQRRMVQCKGVTFGKSVYLVGLAAIGGGTVAGVR